MFVCINIWKLSSTNLGFSCPFIEKKIVKKKVGYQFRKALNYSKFII